MQRKTNRNSYATYRMVPFPMIPNREFKVMIFFKVR